MLLKSFIMSCRAARKALAPITRGYAVRANGPISMPEVPTMHTPALALPPSAASPAAPFGITAKHATILAAFEETARLSYVPAEALLGRLYACHCDRLAQDRQQLVGLEQELTGHLLALDARFPEPVPPPPEKPEPARRRSFGRISRDLHRLSQQ